MDDDDDAIKKRLGQQVRRLREQRGWTQQRLAAEAGIHRNYLGGIERGERNPTVTNVARIASALGIPISTIFEVEQ